MIQLKTPQQIEGIRAASKVVALIHREVEAQLRPGLSTYQIDNMIRHSLRKYDAKSAFLKYRQGNKPPFPAYGCISVNEEVVHGIGAHRRILKDGDVITIDVGTILNGFFGDAAFTMVIGQGTEAAHSLVKDTKAALDLAIEMSRPNVLIHDVADAIYQFATNRGYGVVTNYYGHGVGLRLHEPPQIPNRRPVIGLDPHNINIRIQPGMTFTYEPMFTLGSGETEELEDQWTVVTKDRSLAAHWEHTILITESGSEILTL